MIRSFQDRVLAGEEEARLRATANAARVTLRREVPLSPRPHIKGPKGKRHPARRSRVARLNFAATVVELPRTAEARTAVTTSLRLNVIHVFECQPPRGEPAVEWFLLTNLPVDTTDAIAFAVDCSRGRWAIEEFLKALKTGCQYERRQLESAESLLNALAIFGPVAWRLLLLRHLAGSDRRAPAPPHSPPRRSRSFGPWPSVRFPRGPPCATRCLPSRHSAGTSSPTEIPAGSYSGRGMHDLLLLELGWRARRDAEK